MAMATTMLKEGTELCAKIEANCDAESVIGHLKAEGHLGRC
jgi:hypothetical protein